MDIFVVTRGEGQAPISPPLPPISPSAPAPDIFPVTATGSRERERDQRLPTDFGPHHRRQRQYSAKLDYSGTFHSNYFKADHPIELVQVGFFGPCFEEKAEYFVHVELFEPRNSRELFPECTSPRIAKQKCTLVAQQSQIFYVGFETRVRLEPHVWYLIQFMLDGPCTSRCEYTRRSVQVSAGETNIGFEFNAGSKQMPCLKFRLLHQC